MARLGIEEVRANSEKRAQRSRSLRNSDTPELPHITGCAGAIASTRSGLPLPLHDLERRGNHDGAGRRQLIQIAQARQTEFPGAVHDGVVRKRRVERRRPAPRPCRSSRRRHRARRARAPAAATRRVEARAVRTIVARRSGTPTDRSACSIRCGATPTRRAGMRPCSRSHASIRSASAESPGSRSTSAVTSITHAGPMNRRAGMVSHALSANPAR